MEQLEALVAEGMGVDVESRWGAGFLVDRYVPGTTPWAWADVVRPALEAVGSDAAEAVRQLVAAGWRVTDVDEARPATRFTDVAALLAYARTVPWQLPELVLDRGADPRTARPDLAARLAQLHATCGREGAVTAVSHRFRVTARAPG